MMSKGFYRLNALVFCGLVGLLLGCSSEKKTDNNPTLIIASASNMRNTLDSICEKFTDQTNIKTKLLFASSGKISAQIESGAPYDVFVSANLNYLEQLHSKSFCSKPVHFANGELVFWYKNNANIQNINDLLNNSSITRIAVANTLTAPYGKASKQYLIKEKLWEKLEPKLIYAESIGHVNQFIATGSTDAAFTSLSSVLSMPLSSKGKWMPINPKQTNIKHGVSLVSSSKKDSLSLLFIDFLQDKIAKEILVNSGYSSVLNQVEE